MNFNERYDPKKSRVLCGLNNKFKFLIELFENNKFPKTLLLSGKKGLGKFTLIFHFLHFVFDKANYDLKSQSFKIGSKFNKLVSENIFSNVIFLKGENFKNVKVEDIRNLKNMLSKTNLGSGKRFIILDDIELFNINSLNALLKSIEEPSSDNNYILIDNETRPLTETIISRALKIKFLLKNQERLKIIKSLIEQYNLDNLINLENSNLTPGNFLIYNHICSNFDIDIKDGLYKNSEKILSLYKKHKDMKFVSLLLLLTDIYFFKKITKDKNNVEKLINDKNFILQTVNKLIFYNLNQNSALNAINYKLKNE